MGDVTSTARNLFDLILRNKTAVKGNVCIVSSCPYYHN